MWSSAIGTNLGFGPSNRAAVLLNSLIANDHSLKALAKLIGFDPLIERRLHIGRWSVRRYVSLKSDDVAEPWWAPSLCRLQCLDGAQGLHVSVKKQIV